MELSVRRAQYAPDLLNSLMPLQRRSSASTDPWSIDPLDSAHAWRAVNSRMAFSAPSALLDVDVSKWPLFAAKSVTGLLPTPAAADTAAASSAR